MKLSELKQNLSKINNIEFKLPDGSKVKPHFHVTEVGEVKKKFIDCGGIIREETKISLQLWEAEDFDHRLLSEKLINIIKLSEDKLNLGDHEIEVEYQGNSIEKYDLAFDGSSFLLLSKQTDCLAPDKCGVEEKGKVRLKVSCCEPGGSCC